MSKYEQEIWKSAPGFEGAYEVSNTGRTRSLFRKGRTSGKALKNEITRKGYVRTCFSVEGRQRRFLVHRLVAQLFLPMRQHCSQVNHKDGDRANNDAHNLEWIEPHRNIEHRNNRNGWGRKYDESDDHPF